jgi:hypothetical protein
MPGGTRRARAADPLQASAHPLLARHDPWPSVMGGSYSTGLLSAPAHDDTRPASLDLDAVAADGP